MLLCWVPAPLVGKLRMNKRERIMRKIIPAVIIALCMLGSCNEKPKHYSFVQNMSDGKQVVEEIDAQNDTVALKMFLDRMSKVIIANMENTDSTSAQIESMFVISPDGDTLNTNQELIQAIEMQVLDRQQNARAIPNR